MTFEEAFDRYLDEHGELGSALHFGQAMYEAGRSASRRPKAAITRTGNSWNVLQLKQGLMPEEQAVFHIRGGFVTSVDAKEWARSNGYDV